MIQENLKSNILKLFQADFRKENKSKKKNKNQ
jgi:hypothetical protein